MFNARAHSSYGTNAQVYKTITIPAKDNIYMRFYYFMYSDMSKSYGSMGTLLVTAGSTNIFSKTGNQGKGWKKTDIKLTMSGSKKFTFKANKDRDPYGDIAIDDLWVAEYYKANITNVTASATEVCLNENVNLECNTYNGFPEQDEYLFYKDDQLLARGNNALKTISVKSSIAGNHTYQCSPSTDILGQAPNDTIIITTHALPTVSNPPGRVDVNEGSKVNLVCNATGTGPFTIVWNKKYSSQTWTSKNYTIESALASSDHYSKFTCTVTDANGCKRTSPETIVYVNYKPKNTNIYTSAGTICETGKIYLSCYASARPSVNEYRFILNGKVVQASSTRVINKQNTYPAGSYNWTCSPKNTVGFGLNTTKEIIIKAPPNITWISDNQTVAEGSKVIISCNVTGSDPITITWKKVGGSSSLGNGPNLTLENVTTAAIELSS
ncbi:hemicentin-1 [Exaiptasia diaphana]|uniref:Uncharacterized protein n=1 Tax=Exaiptasia diaphana TaxID=2652724 RepID=A0A913YQN9_EXADI|nr:hemicentin-1 [Exaiptasia diaphana]